MKELDEFVEFCFQHGGTLRNHKAFGTMTRELRAKIEAAQQNRDLRQGLEELLARHRKLEPEEHAPCICWGIEALLKKADAGKAE